MRPPAPPPDLRDAARDVRDLAVRVRDVVDAEDIRGARVLVALLAASVAGLSRKLAP